MKIPNLLALFTGRKGNRGDRVEADGEQGGNMYHVKLVLHRAASRYTYDWELVHTSRQRLSERDRVQLDGQIAAYVRFLAEEKRELGTYSVEKWF